ncbi:MAG: hypothetical protein IPP46_02950 [Bacteroidetes bacterium]|nr:hypothetical protein [Bacteroidota bacterium]
MKFDGEGLSFRNDNASSNISVLQQQRAERFEMPSLVAIGVSYDIKLKEEHRLTPSLSFTANSFIRDQIGLGVEYGFRQLFMLRAGYTFDKKDRNAIVDDEISALIGPSAGVSVMVPSENPERHSELIMVTVQTKHLMVHIPSVHDLISNPFLKINRKTSPVQGEVFRIIIITKKLYYVKNHIPHRRRIEEITGRVESPEVGGTS